MKITQLAPPARYALGTHFKAGYQAAHFAADQLAKMADANGTLQPTVQREQSQKLVRTLQEALCAARELDNILAGNPPPRRGE